jgi:hypothetical protein
MSSDVNPYASPQAEPSPLPAAAKPNPYTPGGHRPFESARGPAYVAMAVILIAMAIDMGVIALRFLEVQMLDRIVGGETVTQAEALASDARVLLAERVRLLAVFIAAIPFLMWLYRSHRNLKALGAAPLQYTPGWTIGGWFIPIGNLFIPYMVVQEVHRGSDPAGFGESQFVRLGQRSVVVMAWWFCWIASGILAQVGVTMFTTSSVGQPELEMLRIASWMLLVTAVLRIGAGVCIIQVMNTILHHQDDRHEIAARAEAAAAKLDVRFVE